MEEKFDEWKCPSCGYEFCSTKDSYHVSCPKCGEEPEPITSQLNDWEKKKSRYEYLYKRTRNNRIARKLIRKMWKWDKKS